MAGIRVHELAKEYGMSSKEMLEKLHEMKIPANNHASTLVEAYEDKVRRELGEPGGKEDSAADEAARRAAALARARAARAGKPAGSAAKRVKKKEEEADDEAAAAAKARAEKAVRARAAKAARGSKAAKDAEEKEAKAAAAGEGEAADAAAAEGAGGAAGAAEAAGADAAAEGAVSADAAAEGAAAEGAGTAVAEGAAAEGAAADTGTTEGAGETGEDEAAGSHARTIRVKRDGSAATEAAGAADAEAAEAAGTSEGAAEGAAEEAAGEGSEPASPTSAEEEHKQHAQAELERREAERRARAQAAAGEEGATGDAAIDAAAEPAKPAPKATSVFDSLLSQIASENDRLAHERAAAEEAKKAAAKAEPPSPYREKGAKKKKSRREAEPVDSSSEDDRYRQMAQAAEKFERSKVLEEARAAVAEAQAQAEGSGGRRKKRKERREAEKAEREAAEAAKKAEALGVAVGTVTVTSGVSVGELAEALDVPGNVIVKKLFLLGTPLTLTQSMSDDLVELIATDLEREIKIISPEEEMQFSFHDDEADLKSRPPVVTVMGHVDHGKTSLLDAIRHSGVQAKEAGGITQAIGASVVYSNDRQITFIDTPGHEAFTAMRARGAQVTDVIVLVVAADDGVMPQTIEAIDHANAAEVPIVVAINKIDKDGANPERVKTELSEHGVICEEWGGKNMFVEVSAKEGTGIDELLETIILQADVLELKANPDTTASGFAIEANLDKGRGPVATVIVQRGTLRVGDSLVCGTCYGHVRALINPKGEAVESAGPSDPVEILGLQAVPSAGDEFAVFADDSEARSLAQERELKQRLAAQEAPRHVTLDDLFARIEAEKLAELNLVIKADTQGSIEALEGQLEKMDQSEVRINVIHASVGGVTATDVTLAAASDAIVIGFGVRPAAGVRQVAEREKVEIRLYKVIYQAIEDINAARVGLLAPEEVEVDDGMAEVRETFKMPKVGVVAGCLVVEGEIAATDKIRVVRDGVIVHDGAIASMRHYRDDVEVVKSGTECGIGIEDFQDIHVGDVLEGYHIEEVARKE